MSGVRFCLERDGPSYVEGSGIWGFGSSRICTRNRGLRVGIPLGRCGFDIFGVEAEVEGSGDLRELSIVLEIGYSVQVVEFHYAAMIIERLAIGIGVKWSQARIMIKCAI